MAKRKVLHMGQGSPKHKHRLSGEWTESSPEEKGLGVLVDQKLNTTQPFSLAAQKTNRTLGCIERSVASMLREGILLLCSALERPHWESSVQLWSPQHRTDLELLERGQRRPQKWFEGWSTSAMRKG